MLKESLKSLFVRDLNKVKLEIEQYQNEKNIWKTENSISNSAGNLCLHLAGNLNTFIGAELGKTGYIRNRELEFSLKDVPRGELIRQIEDTIKIVADSLDQLTEDDLEHNYPEVKVLENDKSVKYMLIYLSSHLAYHLGQINYHRRLLDI
ncbi:DinB superfamily protein [Pedobacter ginsengisoli]|uniref:DinB superfamily protein n=1 Tax=Pedobacter ginsengisoli TaxID=363852 RepID=A0A2D1U392_9SPHI|nr:DUF1572 family protein [Pedobacter ginsengisoli]ATP56075.1 DinB superfamily protein [Pedobacter ginsengisoli]